MPVGPANRITFGLFRNGVIGERVEEVEKEAADESGEKIVGRE